MGPRDSDRRSVYRNEYHLDDAGVCKGTTGSYPGPGRRWEMPPARGNHKWTRAIRSSLGCAKSKPWTILIAVVEDLQFAEYSTQEVRHWSVENWKRWPGVPNAQESGPRGQLCGVGTSHRRMAGVDALLEEFSGGE